LLSFHPDKSNAQSQSSSIRGPTVDDITSAYKFLLQQFEKGVDGGGHEISCVVEDVDLDSFTENEDEGTWSLKCRCGGLYKVSLRVLEEAARTTEEGSDDGEGELVIGCGGCSCFVKVTFGVIDDENDGNDQGDKGD
jgi:hypothetical protein